MSLSAIQNIISVSPPVSLKNYEGNVTECGIRYGFGKQKWEDGFQQKYHGLFYKDCLHISGTYEWIYDKKKYIYEGKIYANNLEGYGSLSHPNGGVYEGLYKNNIRYGPGVFTYPDGSQDVGLWSGSNLIRLCENLSTKKIPSLVNTLRGKIYLTQYKKLVSLSKPPSCADKILTKLNANETLKQQKAILYNSFVRNPISLFFDRDDYDNQYFSDENCIVDVVMSFKNGVGKLQKQVASDILAWNNEEDLISIMKHIFLHRKYENNMSFSINNILIGAMNNSRIRGVLENACVELIASSSNGNHKKISQLITEFDLNPDVCDMLGNSGIHFAASKDDQSVIKCLVNYGANLDRVNDEGLTPILICILRYIEIKENIQDWEKGFLPSFIPDVNVQQWRPHMYIDKGAKRLEEQLYLLDIKCKHPEIITKKKGKSSTPKIEKGDRRKSKIKDDLEVKVSEVDLIALEIEKAIKIERMQEICNTIAVLLQYGADPNYGEVPLPPLILSIFTKNEDLILQLINYGANCDITTSYHDGSLTPLHVITALPPDEQSIRVAEILLEHGADPNPRANIDHWLEEKQIIEAGATCDDQGKTPLHLLAIRYDFIEDHADHFGALYEMLVKYGCNPDLYYLGHTCLSLAMLRGNMYLINRILGSYEVDPNQLLGCNMGVPLTLFTLKKYRTVLPLYTISHIYELLNKYNANPFMSIPPLDSNAIEFAEEENEEGDKDKREKVKKSKKDPYTGIINCLLRNAQDVLERYIQGKVIRNLHDFKIQCEFSDPIFDAMVKFVDVDDTIRILQICVDNDVLESNPATFLALLKYVKRKTAKKGKSESRKQKLEILAAITKVEHPVRKVNVPIPEIDPDDDKYIVCFNCFKKKNLRLILCPKCELVYFCSENCNKISVKRNTKHKCKGIFYNKELKNIKIMKLRGETFYPKMVKFKARCAGTDSSFEFDIKYAYSNYIGSVVSGIGMSKTKHKHGKGKSDDELGDSRRRGRSKTRRKRGAQSASEISTDEKGKKKKKKKHSPSSESPGKSKSKKGSKRRKSVYSTSGSRSRIKKSKERDKSKEKGKGKDKSKSKKRGKGKETETGTERSKSKGKAKEKRDAKSKSKKRSKSDAKDKTKSVKIKKTHDVRHIREDIHKSGKTTERMKDKFGSQGKQAKSRSPSREATGTRVDVDQAKAMLFHAIHKAKYDMEMEKRPTLGEKYKGLISDSSGLLYVLKLNKSHLPCCVLINGQLYYKFEANTYCEINYSHI